MESFSLHPRLKADTFEIGDLALSRLLLMNDRRFPWVILVPRCRQPTDLDHLTEGERSQLIEEAAWCSQIIKGTFGATKINLGALGNLVSQLHMHVIGRNTADPLWPKAVWGQGEPVPYTPAEVATALALWQSRMPLR